MGGPGRASSALVLAGDVGGTKTLLGLFESGEGRPRALAIVSYRTAAFPSFTDVLSTFVRDVGGSRRIDAAAVGVAGPVVDNRARLTNATWTISAGEMVASLGGARARLINDLEATANSLDVLAADEVVVLQEGVPRVDGNAVVIAAGTGLGEAYAHRVDGRFRPLASEGGHADFAPRTDREVELLRMLRAEHGRVEVEHILSGPGLLNVHRFTHDGRGCPELGDRDADGRAAAISEAALAGRCPACVEALSIFVCAYGAEAGNLALRGVATAGVYVGGGIAPKILPALQDGRFIATFRAKGAMSALLSRLPVRVIVNPEAALLGAAVQAVDLLAG